MESCVSLLRPNSVLSHNCPLISFDVTPAELISGIVTEKGVILRNSEGSIDVKSFVALHS